MARGWQSGISSCVFLAAMMPAMRAVASTSPFLAVARLDQRQRAGRHGDEALGARRALRDGLVRDVDHARLALVVEMGELGHGATRFRLRRRDPPPLDGEGLGVG